MNIQLSDRLKSGYFRLINIFNILLGIFLIVLILMLVRDIVAITGRKMEKPAVRAAIASQAAKKGIQEYAAIVRNNPFGPPGEFRPLAAVSDKSVSMADVSGLTLVGTVSGSQKHSYAIFIDKSNNQELFRVGDAVQGYGKLHKVEKDKVIINRGGIFTEMQLADILSVTEVSASQNAGKPAVFAKNVGEGAYVVDQRRLHQAIDKPGQIMTDARLLPNTVDGKQQGFTLNEVKQGGIYQSLGLQNGDVLLRINEYNISNPENALQAFNALKGMDRVQLDIVRNGTKTTMNYQIR